MARPKLRDEELRSQFLAASLVALEAGGPTALTARNLARSTNSSTAALYELFGDKSGLIRSLFYGGFAELAGRLGELPTGADARQDVRSSLDTIRSFALESPMLYEVMFARPFAEFTPNQDHNQVARDIYTHTTSRVARWLGRTRRSRTTVDAAQALIAANRGLIASELAGILGSPSAVDRRRTLTLEALLDGLAAQPDPS